MDILSLFTHSRTELGVVEVAELIGCPKSTASRRLSSMEEAGFLDRDDGPKGRYHLGVRLVTLGHLAREATPLQRMSRPALRKLTEATGETSDLVILRDREAVNVEAVESPRPMKHVGWAGRRIPLHATAAGKALLAWRPRAEVRELLGRRLDVYTPRTIRSLQALFQELDRIREDGHALSIGEFEADLIGVAAPVRDHVGTVVASATIGAPASRAGEQVLPDLVAAVREAAHQLSRMLGYRDGGAPGPPP